MFFLENETQITEKLMDNVFQWNCSSHAKIRTNLSKIEKQSKISQRSVMLSALQLPNIHLQLYSYHAKLCPMEENNNQYNQFGLIISNNNYLHGSTQHPKTSRKIFVSLKNQLTIQLLILTLKQPKSCPFD